MLPLLTTISVSLGSTDVLFVGNSYTQNNNLPGTVQAVFEAAGRVADTQKVSSGGLTLADHASRAADPSSAWYRTLVTEADDRQWVVLQDQSQVPGFPETEPMWIASRDGAVALDELVRTATADTMYFITWGRRSGDPMNEWLYPDFSAMQTRLTNGYLAYAAATSTEDRPTWVAPVGPAFQVIHDEIAALGIDPTEPGNAFYNLYSGDGSHPSAAGTQLAAYVFYAALTGETPVGLPTPTGIDDADASMLQEAAARVVFDETDPFSFPWEASTEAPDTGTPDTGARDTDALDSGMPDCTEPDPADPDRPDEGGPDANMEPATDADTRGNAPKKSGCTTVRHAGGIAVVLMTLLGRIRRQAADR